MKRIFKNYSNIFLTALTVLFLAIIVGYFMWGIGYLVTQLNRANNEQVAGNENQGFDLKGAASLDYRGISTSTGQ